MINNRFIPQPLETDSHSKFICNKCWREIETFHLFFGKVKTAQESLNEHPVECDENIVKLLPILLSHNDTERSAITTKFRKHDYKPLDADKLLNKSTGCVTTKSKPEMAPKKTNAVKSKKDSISSAITKRTKPTLTKHKAMDKQICDFFNMACELCTIVFESFRDVCSHYPVVHGVYRGYVKCCDRKFFIRDTAIEHINWHSNPEMFKCEMSIHI